MELRSGKVAGRLLTPIQEKDPTSPSPNLTHVPNHSENSNPNLTTSSPCFKSSNSPSPSLNKSSKKSHSSLSSNPPVSLVLPSPSPRNKIRQRKFVVAKKNPKNAKTNTSTVACKCKISGKCLCVAYEMLRASQDDFFKNPSGKGSNLTLPNPNLDLNNTTDGPVSQHAVEVELSDEMVRRPLSLSFSYLRPTLSSSNGPSSASSAADGQVADHSPPDLPVSSDNDSSPSFPTFPSPE